MNTTGIMSMVLIFFNLMLSIPKPDNDKLIIPEDISTCPTYENISYFTNEAIGLEKEGKYGFLDFSGNELIPFMYENAGSFSNGLAPVCLNSKFGYINMKNEVVIPFEYDFGINFNDDYAIVVKNGKYGVIDKTGKVKIPFEYSNLTDEFFTSEHKVFRICVNQKYGLIDVNGEFVIPVKYDNLKNQYLFTQTNSFIIAQLENKYGVIDYSGNILLPFEYDFMEVAGEEIVSVQKDKKWAVLDIYGNVISPYGEKGYDPIGEGFYIRGSRFDTEGVSLFNSEGEEILSEGIAVGNRAYKFGYIEVQIKRKTQLINFEGRIITDFDYDSFIYAGNGNFFITKNDGRKGIWNNGKEILFDYDINDITEIDEDGVIYARNTYLNRLYVFSPDGNLIKCFEGNYISNTENFYIIRLDNNINTKYKLVSKN